MWKLEMICTIFRMDGYNILLKRGGTLLSSCAVLVEFLQDINNADNYTVQ